MRLVASFAFALAIGASSEVAAANEVLECGHPTGKDDISICQVAGLTDQHAELIKAAELAGVEPAEHQQWLLERNRRCGISENLSFHRKDIVEVERCLSTVYTDRWIQLYKRPLPSVAQLKRIPYRPRLTTNLSGEICRAFEAAAQDAFISMGHDASVVDRAWPGVDVTWIFSPKQLSGLDLENLRIEQPADLDSDGKIERLILTRERFNWRGSISTLTRIAAANNQEAHDVDGERESKRPQGDSILVAPESEDVIPYLWEIPAVLKANGRYYLATESAKNAAPAKLFRIPAAGRPELVCAVERSVRNFKDIETAAGVFEWFSDLDSMIGVEGNCGKLHSLSNLINLASLLRRRALLRPWTVDGSGLPETQETIRDWLFTWATQGVTNWDLHGRFKANTQKARVSLAAWYHMAFGLADAEIKAAQIIDALIEGHFSFPYHERPPAISPLRLALLRGASTDEVAYLMASRFPASPGLFPELGDEAPLVLALRHPHLVRFLIKKGESVHSVNSFGKTPLMYAAQINATESVRLLLSAGADVNARTNRPSELGCALVVTRENRTPLHYAAENAGIETIQLLVKAGADITAAISSDIEPGVTPFDLLQGNKKLSASDRAAAEAILRPNR